METYYSHSFFFFPIRNFMIFSSPIWALYSTYISSAKFHKDFPGQTLCILFDSPVLSRHHRLLVATKYTVVWFTWFSSPVGIKLGARRQILVPDLPFIISQSLLYHLPCWGLSFLLWRMGVVTGAIFVSQRNNLRLYFPSYTITVSN